MHVVVFAQVLRDRMVELLGKDATKDSPLNPFWHTGNPVSLTSGDYRERTPWVWMFEVAEGRSLGKGRGGKPKHWQTYVDQYMQYSMPGYWRECRQETSHGTRAPNAIDIDNM